MINGVRVRDSDVELSPTGTDRRGGPRTLAASDNVLNRHRFDRKGSSGQTPRGAPMMMRSNQRGA
jgi:hypothetical protein